MMVVGVRLCVVQRPLREHGGLLGQALFHVQFIIFGERGGGSRRIEICARDPGFERRDLIGKDLPIYHEHLDLRRIGVE